MKISLKNIYKQMFINEDIKSFKYNKRIEDNNADFSYYSNIIYDSSSVNNVFDFFVPKHTNKKLPTIFLVHGGGYVGGFKENLNKLALHLVESGYCVVNVEYTKSFGLEDKYMPTPVYELFDLFKFLQNNEKYNKFIDYDNIFLAGDSAGGHICSLVANIQSNPNLKLDFNLTGGPQIKGLILTCPVFGVYKFKNFPPRRQYESVVYGDENPLKDICHNFDVITDKFPPSIMFSTQKDFIAGIHSKMFIKKAKNLNLSVDFYNIKKAYKLGHDSMVKFTDIYTNYTTNINNFINNAINNQFVDGVNIHNIEETKKLNIDYETQTQEETKKLNIDYETQTQEETSKLTSKVEQQELSN